MHMPLQILYAGTGMRFRWLELPGQQGTVIFDDVWFMCDEKNDPTLNNEPLLPCVVFNVTTAAAIPRSARAYGQLTGQVGPPCYGSRCTSHVHACTGAAVGN